MELTRFELEGLPGTFEGWHDPAERWNGFANPLLGREESERLAGVFSEQVGDGPRYEVRFEAKADAFRVSSVEGGVVVNVDHIKRSDVQEFGHVYDWGHGWCWLEEGYWA